MAPFAAITLSAAMPTHATINHPRSARRGIAPATRRAFRRCQIDTLNVETKIATNAALNSCSSPIFIPSSQNYGCGHDNAQIET